MTNALGLGRSHCSPRLATHPFPREVNAMIAVEDANFYRHPGVDPQGILRVALRNILRCCFS